MGALTHLPIRQVFKRARRLREGETTPPRNSRCDARQRLGVDPVRSVKSIVSIFLSGIRIRHWTGTSDSETLRKLGILGKDPMAAFMQS